MYILTSAQGLPRDASVDTEKAGTGRVMSRRSGQIPPWLPSASWGRMQGQGHEEG